MGIAACVAVCVSLPSVASAGEIVYQHGNDLWVMNDNGTGQQPLITAAEVGASSLSQPSLDPATDALSFVANTPAPDGVCSAYCDAVYSLVGNTITRLSPPASDCTAIDFSCGSDDEGPSTTVDGRSVFTYSSYVDDLEGSVASVALDVSPLDGSTAPTAWPLPSGGSTPLSDQETENDFSVTTADPVDANDIAYDGSTYCYKITTDTGCETGIVVEDSATPTNTHVVAYDDEPEAGLAFTPDGSHLADIEVGDYRGIWIYTNTDVNASSASTAWHGWYVLADPLQDSNDGSNPDQTTFKSITVTNTGAIVFDNGTNVYEVPSSCWGTSVGERSPTTSATPVADCGTFGQSSSKAVQLTTDGTTSAVDVHPTWTSAALSPYAPPSPAPSPSTGTGPSSTPGSAGSGSSSSSGSSSGSKTGGSSATPGGSSPGTPLPAVQQAFQVGPASVNKGIVTLGVSLSTAATITVKVERVLSTGQAARASTARKKKQKPGAKTKLIGILTFNGTAGLNKLKIKKVGGHDLAKGKYLAVVTVAGVKGPGDTVPFTLKH